MFTRIRLELALYAAAFFVSSWDLVLSRKVGGFTLKLYQPLFLLCAALTVWGEFRAGRLDELLAPLRRPFALAALSLALFYLGMAPWSAYPLKSFLYSTWLLFDLFAIWLTTQHLFRSAPPCFFKRVALAPLLFASAVILVDSVAYSFGHRGGLIGFNQDIFLNLGVSRPHAFSNEPSYAAVLLCLGLLTVGPHLLLRTRHRWLSVAALLAILFAILATTSRTGWACLGLGFFLLGALPLLAGKRLPWKKAAAAAVVAPALVGLFLLVFPADQLRNLNEKFVSSLIHGNDSSGASRMKAFGVALDMARETHWLGAGVGASYRYYKDHGGYDYNFQEKFNERMNGNEVIMSTWGQLLAEGGVAALLLYGLAGFLLARALWASWRAKSSILAFGSLTACLVFFGFGALWLGNVCRGDVWVWYALWSGFAQHGDAPAA